MLPPLYRQQLVVEQRLEPPPEENGVPGLDEYVWTMEVLASGEVIASHTCVLASSQDQRHPLEFTSPPHLFDDLYAEIRTAPGPCTWHTNDFIGPRRPTPASNSLSCRVFVTRRTDGATVRLYESGIYEVQSGSGDDVDDHNGYGIGSERPDGILSNFINVFFDRLSFPIQAEEFRWIFGEEPYKGICLVEMQVSFVMSSEEGAANYLDLTMNLYEEQDFRLQYEINEFDTDLCKALFLAPWAPY